MLLAKVKSLNKQRRCSYPIMIKMNKQSSKHIEARIFSPLYVKTGIRCNGQKFKFKFNSNNYYKDGYI